MFKRSCSEFIGKQLADAALEQPGHASVFPIVAIDIGLQPFILAYVFPANLITAIYYQMFKQNALCPTIPFTKRMNHVEVGIKNGGLSDQAQATQSLEVIQYRQPGKKFVRLRFNPGGRAKTRSLLADIHTSDITSPIIEVCKKLAMQ
ncbi:hypothetical protein IGB42_03996 [Andreprevotia sp. IGB-42]|nr:hypothetical protein [Andreprevotia sp. IGB-42]KAF0811539.1 hypothetical protein IGB42_03996 [Andreprevotia sp. IGB-42]